MHENLIYFLLCSFGITELIVSSKLMKPLREFLKFDFFSCAQCVGFWVSLGLYFLMWGKPAIVCSFIMAFIGSGAIFFAHNIMIMIIDIQTYYKFRIMTDTINIKGVE